MKKLKKWWKVTRALLRIGLCFWLLETIVFLIIDGWHWSAVRYSEQICDIVVSIILTCGWLSFLYTLMILIDGIIDGELFDYDDDEYDEPDYSTTRVDDSKCACGGTFEKVGDPIIEKDKVQHGQVSLDVHIQTYECNQCERRNFKCYAGSLHGYLVVPPKR